MNKATVAPIYSLNPDNPVNTVEIKGKNPWDIADIYNKLSVEIGYLSELANKCRTENTDQSLSSMLRELDSTLQEIKDLTETE